MSENKHTAYDLAQMQSLPLEVKIRMSQRRIREWYDHWDGEVYVSFSGGKDSTVLLHLVREMYPEVPAVFVDTGLEYPEIKQFVRTFENVTILRPQMSFKQVIEKYGYPVISKEVSHDVYYARRVPDGKVASKFVKDSPVNLKYGNRYSRQKYAFLLDADIPISHHCCDVLKKSPIKAFERSTGKKAILGQLASESHLRKVKWEQHGCNAFSAKRPVSNPLSFWTEQDILTYIVLNRLAIAKVYGEVVIEENGGFGTTGVNRTGCVFCLFGAHLEPHPNRFERLKITHPQLWGYCMKSQNEGGLGLRKVCRLCGISTGDDDETP